MDAPAQQRAGFRGCSGSVSVRLRNAGAAISVLISVTLLGAPAALAGSGGAKPSADELWRTYPLYPTVSPAPRRPAVGHPRRPTARPAADRPAAESAGVVAVVFAGL